MLQMTFLGWQGWLVQSSTTRLLIDPLLAESVGRGTPAMRSSFPFWPPRDIDRSKLPAVDGLVLSHEHEDHFNLPTLMMLDRQIPVYLSSRSSFAACGILGELGFRASMLEPGCRTAIGDLVVTTFAGDHSSVSQGDEWDALAYLIEQSNDDGGFFTNVDVAVNDAMVRRLSRIRGDVITFIAMKLARFANTEQNEDDIGQGHHPARASELRSAEDGLHALKGYESFRPMPGQTVVLENGQLSNVLENTPYLSVASPPWVEREALWPEPAAPLAPPRCGLEGVGDEDLVELEAGLRELATHLYGSSLFKLLYSLSMVELGGRQPTFGLILKDGNKPDLVYIYEPRACGFIRKSTISDRADTHAGEVTLWATDLLSLFRGEMEPRMITRHIKEAWAFNAHAPFTIELWMFFHPLRRPEQTLTQYRRTVRNEGDVDILVRRNKPAATAVRHESRCDTITPGRALGDLGSK